MDLENLNMIMDQVARDKGISREILVEALEAAMLTAARKVFGLERDIEAHFNEDTGEVELFEFRTVVQEITEPEVQITVVEAEQILRDESGEDDPVVDIGESIGLRIYKEELGRIAAQTAKQVIIQRVREAERENIYNEYADRTDELVTGVVRRFERGSIVVDLGRAEAVLPAREQVPRESYRVTDRIQAYVLDVNKQARGSQIVLSRTSPGLLIKLFEMEVPEIYEGIVRIEAAAREPGARSKIAVASSDRDVDPVGACVGMKGSRVQAVVQELRGEKVDIVPWDEDAARFVCNALAPAEVSRVLIDESNHAMEIIVPDDQLSLAIGRRGQNVRLASQLSGWRLDIVSETKVREVKDRAFLSLTRLKGMNDILMQTLYNYGIRSAQEVLDNEESFLAGIPGMDADRAKTMKADAVRVVEEEKAEVVAEKAKEEVHARDQAAAMQKEAAFKKTLRPEAERMLCVRGVSEDIAQLLEEAGILFVEDLPKISFLQALAEKTGLEPEKLDQLRHAAGVYLEKEARGEEPPRSSEDAGPEPGYTPAAELMPEADADRDAEDAS